MYYRDIAEDVQPDLVLLCACSNGKRSGKEIDL